MYNIEKRKLNKDDVESKLAFKNSIFNVLHEYNSIALNEIILKKLSEEIDVSYESLVADYNRQPKQRIITTPNAVTKTVQVDKDEQIKNRFLTAEQKLVELSVASKRNCMEIISGLDNSFVDKDNYHLFLHLREYYNQYEEFDFGLFESNLSAKEKEKLDQALKPKYDFDANIKDLINDVKAYVIIENEKLANAGSPEEKLGKKIKKKRHITRFGDRGNN